MTTEEHNPSSRKGGGGFIVLNSSCYGSTLFDPFEFMIPPTMSYLTRFPLSLPDFLPIRGDHHDLLSSLFFFFLLSLTTRFKSNCKVPMPPRPKKFLRGWGYYSKMEGGNQALTRMVF
jgi:hypothetical protein